MDNKNVLHTEQVSVNNNKTYFFDLKEAKTGGSYLKITQSRLVDEDQRERKSFILFEKDLAMFSHGLMRSLMAFQGKSPEEREAYRESIRVNHPNAFKPWSKDDEENLVQLFREGYDVEDLAKQFQRNVGGIRARIKKLGLLEQPMAAEA